MAYGAINLAKEYWEINDIKNNYLWNYWLL